MEGEEMTGRDLKMCYDLLRAAEREGKWLSEVIDIFEKQWPELRETDAELINLYREAKVKQSFTNTKGTSMGADGKVGR
jgi:hypothetical protein